MNFDQRNRTRVDMCLPRKCIYFKLSSCRSSANDMIYLINSAARQSVQGQTKNFLFGKKKFFLLTSLPPRIYCSIFILVL